MERLDAFRDAPKKTPKAEAPEAQIPAYQPKVMSEEYEIEGGFQALIDHMDKSITVTDDIGDCMSIPFGVIPDVLQFLAWVARERIKEA